MKKTAILLAALLVAAPVSAAPRSVERTISVSKDVQVDLEMVAGSLRVEGWDRPEVKVTGTIDSDFEDLDIDHDDGEVSIEVEIHRSSRSRQAARLDIRVPRAASLEVETISANVEIVGVAGEIDVESVSGSIDVRGPVQWIDAGSVSGSIEVRSDALLRRGDFETVSGSVELGAALSRDARVEIEVLNGSVTLRLPADTCAEFHVETFNGSIDNDFGRKAERVSEFLPGKELRFSTGSCKARVTIEAFNGAVRLKRD